MRAEIISVGTELLLGEVADSNAAYLASELPLLGIGLCRITVVDDNLERLVEVFGEAWKRSDLVLSTGGLGPTEDDLTREAIAAMLGEKAEISELLVTNLRAIFVAMGRQMPAANIKQASLISSSQAIRNIRGTAPGWWVEKEGRILVAMPGPPSEMRLMWQKEVVPRLQDKGGESVIQRRTLKCFGLSEAEVGEKAATLCTAGNPELGIYAKADGVHLRMIARAATAREANDVVAASETLLRDVLGRCVWGVDEDTLEGIVARLLASLELTVATIESCTGGLLGSMLTDVAGSSAYYKGGVVAYSNEAKVAFGLDAELIKQHGAVSREVATAMADAARFKLQADIGLAITGVAGPDSMEGKPPGLVYIAVSDRAGGECTEARYPGGRGEVKRRAAAHALFIVRQRLLTTV